MVCVQGAHRSALSCALAVWFEMCISKTFGLPVLMLELAAVQGDFSGFTLVAEWMLVRPQWTEWMFVRFPEGFLICIPQLLILPLSCV